MAYHYHNFLQTQEIHADNDRLLIISCNVQTHLYKPAVLKQVYVQVTWVPSVTLMQFNKTYIFINLD